MSALHEAISNIDLVAMRASLDAGASPYSLDDKGRNAWDRINNNPMFHVHLGSKSRSAWSIRELLNDMAKVPPKTLQERAQGEQSHADALSHKVAGAALVAGLIKKAILKMSKLQDAHLDALGFENIGRRQVEQALAGRALNPALPPQEAAVVRAQLEQAEHQGAAQGAARLKGLDVDARGLVVETHADGTVTIAKFVFLDNSLLQDFVEEVQAIKDAVPPGDAVAVEIRPEDLVPPAPTPPPAPHLSAMPDVPAPVPPTKALPVGGRPPRLSVVASEAAPPPVPAVDAWRADRPAEDPKPQGPKPFNRPPRVG